MIGIIFYEYTDKIKLYLRKNTKDYYEDIMINNIDNNFDCKFNNILDNVSPIFKSYNKELNHTTLILNIKKYNELFELIKDRSDIVKISLKHFNNQITHKNIKHKRIRTYDLINTLNLINLNHILKNKC